MLIYMPLGYQYCKQFSLHNLKMFIMLIRLDSHLYPITVGLGSNDKQVFALNIKIIVKSSK